MPTITIGGRVLADTQVTVIQEALKSFALELSLAVDELSGMYRARIQEINILMSSQPVTERSMSAKDYAAYWLAAVRRIAELEAEKEKWRNEN